MMFGVFRVIFLSEVGIYFILGVIFVFFCWFMGLSIFILLFSYKFNDKVFKVINIVCGLVIIFYGVKLLLNFYKMFIYYIY